MRLETKDDEHEDHCLKVIEKVKEELKKLGFSPSDYEKILVEEFYSCVEEGFTHKMRKIDPHDRKAIRGYVRSVIDSIQKG